MRCPKCQAILRIPAADAPAKRSHEPLRAAPAAPFPGVGVFLGWLAIIVGMALVGLGLLITVIASDGGFKPAGLIVFAFPGALWMTCGGLLLKLQRKFVTPFWIFLAANNLLGVFFATQARSLGSASDAQVFAAVGLGYILGSIVVGLVHALLTRDVQKMDK